MGGGLSVLRGEETPDYSMEIQVRPKQHLEAPRRGKFSKRTVLHACS